MDKDNFETIIRSRLAHYFEASKEGHKDHAERHRIEGFIQAGIAMKLTSLNDMNEIMEGVHFEVFQKSISERKKESAKTWSKEGVDYSSYDIPTYSRK